MEESGSADGSVEALVDGLVGVWIFGGEEWIGGWEEWTGVWRSGRECRSFGGEVGKSVEEAVGRSGSCCELGMVSFFSLRSVCIREWKKREKNMQIEDRLMLIPPRCSTIAKFC